ncbi:MAG: hypothetical protein K9J17_17275 [Flavobacteriales bacterium]|nr:hypothetical protein [Flavobacteriales bacterium]
MWFYFTPVVAQNFDWAASIGGLGLDVGRAVTTDADGNVIVVGSFTGSTHIADTFLTGSGSMEGFVAKFTSEGEFQWARVISGPAEDMARGVVTEPNGNIFVVGHFTDTVTFSVSEEDTAAVGSRGGQDAFIAKYSPSGEFIWYLTGGGPGDDTATDIDRYEWSGKLYVSGGYEKRAQFGLETLLSSGLTDAFLLKMDPDGNAHWIRSGGGSEHDIAAAVAVGNDESVYIVGDFYEQATFDATTIEALGSSDMYLAKYSENGNLEWVRSNGGTTVDVATGVGTDLNGNVYVSGYYQGTTFFQGYSVSALSYNDIFLSQFDANGNCNWLQSAGSWGLDNCLGMAVAWDGSTYLTGMFEELIIADGDSVFGDGYDIFILHYAPSGMIRYGRAAGAGSADIGMATCIGPDQSLYVTGYYFYFADFDQTTIGAADHGDCFLARMSGILGIPEVSGSDASDCLRFNLNNNRIIVNCVLQGDWQMHNALGQKIGQGQFSDGQIQIPQIAASMYLLTVSSGSQQWSIPWAMPLGNGF